MTGRPGLIPIRVSGDGVNATRTDIRAGKAKEFLLVSDEPPERHGNNEGMLPLEAFLAGYVACSNVIMNMIAGELGITLSGIKLGATGYLDPRGYTGAEQLATPFVRVTLQIDGKAGGNTEKLDELKSQLRWRCPAAATFNASGTEVTETWNLSEA